MRNHFPAENAKRIASLIAIPDPQASPYRKAAKNLLLLLLLLLLRLLRKLEAPVEATGLRLSRQGLLRVKQQQQKQQPKASRL
ncbi:hypothetical protein ACSSS7_005681 [Eimeria intestinalis]